MVNCCHKSSACRALYLALFGIIVINLDGVDSSSLPTTVHPIVEKTPSNGTPAPATTLVSKSAAPSIVDAPSNSVTTIGPNATPKLDTTILPAASRSAAVGAAKSGVEKIDSFLEPICGQLDKIVPKQAFKIQSQFKQLVEKTNGKLSICFLEHYKIDPSLNPISKGHMVNMCHSRSNTQPNKSNFKAFLSCAAENWDIAAEKELDRIINARQDHVKNHKHDLKPDDGAPSLLHGDDEVSSIINDVVSKALIENRSEKSSNENIKLIDLTDKNPTTDAPSATGKAKPDAAATGAEKKLMNDPNTLMVFVDDSTTISPTHHQAASTNLFGATITTEKPVSHLSHDKTRTTMTPSVHVSNNVTIKASVQTTSKPHPAAKVAISTTKLPAPTSKLVATSTHAPSIAKTTARLSTSKAPMHVSTPTKQASTTAVPVKGDSPATTTTGSPSGKKSPLDAAIKSVSSKPALSTTKAASTASPKKSVSTTKIPTKKPSEKPLETLESVLKKQETEKQEFEKKLKEERDNLIKRLQKKQDEIDAQNAIRAMQTQRNHANDHDNRMHQIEHERQMTIDPIGHTIKHQQYELRKQQRMSPNNGR